MRRVWEREGWRRAELQWVQRQDARWRSKGGKGVSWRLRQRKQRQRRLAGRKSHSGLSQAPLATLHACAERHSAVKREFRGWGKRDPGPGACDQMGAGAGSWDWSGALECPVSIRWAVGERSWPAMLCRLAT